MPCYCTNDTPCRPCLDGNFEAILAEEFNRSAAAILPAPPFDGRNWTPADEDDREHDRKILDSMIAEGYGSPSMAHSLLTLYPDDQFTPADLDTLRKMDAKWSHY